MIEINLLPPQYRTVERTPLPVFVGILAAIALIGGAVVVLAMSVQKTAQLEEQVNTTKQQLAEARTKGEEYDKLIKKITEARGRIEAVLNIAESKIPWALKLEQLVEIMPRNIWIDNLTAERTAGGGGELRLGVNARGTSLQRISEFKQLIRSNTNFFYHFDRIRVPKILVKSTPPEVLEPEYLTFQMTLPLRQVERGGKQERRR